MTMKLESSNYMGYIYLIKNRVNDKIYIGQTKRTIELRWKEHLYEASKSINKQCPYFHRAIKKYGEKSFEIIQLDTASTKEELNLKEIYYIKLYNSNNPLVGYNLTKGGESGKTTEVCQLDLNGKLIAQYNSIAEASKKTGCCSSAIIGCCINRYNSSLGYQWCYTKNLANRINIPASTKRQTNIPVVQLDEDDNIIKVWDSIAEAEQALSIPHSKISAVCRGKRKTTGSFKWKYLFPEQISPSKEHKSNCAVNQYDKNGNFIRTFSSINEAALSIGQKKGGHISDVCKGKRPFCGGYKWEYAM